MYISTIYQIFQLYLFDKRNILEVILHQILCSSIAEIFCNKSYKEIIFNWNGSITFLNVKWVIFHHVVANKIDRKVFSNWQCTEINIQILDLLTLLFVNDSVLTYQSFPLCLKPFLMSSKGFEIGVASRERESFVTHVRIWQQQALVSLLMSCKMN